MTTVKTNTMRRPESDIPRSLPHSSGQASQQALPPPPMTGRPCDLQTNLQALSYLQKEWERSRKTLALVDEDTHQLNVS
ncbi:hypothetical protein E2C01_019494 [Portunus trituberculatus]|uniref:Uncharacterized protein n=1 Tax=Portunus trituberculatus TaxID=210409 RepID=A0A5B7DZ01_PORTR|nr:hypothetical protein [Portunus trituberculatus]